MAAVAAPVSFRLTSSAASFRRASLKTRARLPAVRARGRMVCAAAAKNYNITLLPGDGIGPEIMKVAKEVLEEVGSASRFLLPHSPDSPHSRFAACVRFPAVRVPHCAQQQRHGAVA